MTRVPERSLVVAVCLAIVWFYFWTVRSNGAAWNFGAEQRDYYNLLIDGYLDGHLHMKVEVPAALLELQDPYDPAQRPPGLGLHDASFYQGRYYVYFGVAPAVMLMLPFRILTGVDLPLPAAILVFASAGFLVSAALWLALRRRYFPHSGIALSIACIVTLGTAAMVPLLLRRPSIWELPLSGGYFFGACALACVYRSLHSPRAGLKWLAGASVGLGLAVASRPTYLFAGLLLTLPVLWAGRTVHGAERRRVMLRHAVAAFLPIAIIGSGLALYNLARFGDPLEFGVRYQFSGIYESKARHFSWEYLGYNLRLYFFQPAAWSWHFPFLHEARPPAPPPGHFGFEFVFGLLVCAPVFWLAFAAPAGVRYRDRDAADRLRPFLMAAAGAASGMILVAGFFYAAMGRYQVDFAPTLVLLAAVGVLVIEDRIKAARRGLRIAVHAVLASALALSIAFGALASIGLYGDLRRLNPGMYARLATLANYPAFWVEKLIQVEWGPLELTIRPSREAPAGREVLVATGTSGAADAVFLENAPDGRVRIGFIHGGGNALLSRPLSLDPASDHRVRIELGSLVPPEEHPAFRRRETAAVRRATRRLCVLVNGEVVLEGYQRFHPAVGRRPLVADGAAVAATGLARFSGEVVRMRRDTNIERLMAAETSRLILRVQFVDAPTTQWQPLFHTGSGAGLWRIVAPGQAQLGYAMANGSIHAFAPVETDLGRTHELEWSATTWPEAIAASDGAGESVRLVARIDGVVVGTWTGANPVRLQDWSRNREVMRHPEIAPAFAGLVHGSEFFAGDPVQEFRSVRIRLIFPSNKPGAREPLLVTGEPGGGDQVFVEYLGERRVRFGIEHWGKPPLWSEPVDVTANGPHVVEIALASFPRSEGNAETGRMPARLSLDGRAVGEWETRLYPVEAKDVFVGRNPIGGTACGPYFTGSVLATEFVNGGADSELRRAERGAAEPPPDKAGGNTGRE